MPLGKTRRGVWEVVGEVETSAKGCITDNSIAYRKWFKQQLYITLPYRYIG
jgi:hypothetical protein